MRLLTSGVVLASVACLTACGAKVVVDGTGGMVGTGGSPSTTGPESTVSTGTTPMTTVTSSGTGVSCPDPFPGIEASCDQEGQVCQVPGACCEGSAICKGGFWQFNGPLCDMPCGGDCGPGDFSCAVGKLCVTLLGKITTYQCADSPCDAGLDCSCAAPLCEAEGLICNNIQDGFKVLCDCNGDC